MSQKFERRCVSCRQIKAQNEMIRVAKIGDDYVLDLKFKLGGRGAYVCKDKDCIQNTIKKRCLNKSFKANVDSQIYEQLGEYGQNN
ncbi:MAG: YlxR family protein [Candidatus Onthoplasma sp.]